MYSMDLPYNAVKLNGIENSVKNRLFVSPWRNVAEFRDVCEWIFGEMANRSTKERAIAELRIWMNRRRTQCPAAVYATHAMLEVQLADERMTCDSGNLQSLYAFALVRFFNFMSSTLQTHNNRSMYNTAKELGLASFVVDIRHICAHGTELPELDVLRKTVDYCLSWLSGYYWRALSEKMNDVNGQALRDRDKNFKSQIEYVEELFDIYDIVLECHLKHCETMKKVKSVIHGRRLAKLKEYLSSKQLTTIRAAFDVIVLDMYALTKSGTSQKNLPSVFAKAFTKMKFFFTVVETHSKDYDLESLFEVVQNLFRFFAVYEIIELVVARLFQIAESSQVSDAQRAGICFWTKHIVDGLVTFMSCKRKFHATFDEEAKVPYDPDLLNLGEFSRNVRHTYVYSGVDMKRTILFGDSFQRHWVWHFRRSFLEKRLKAINHFTAPILSSMIPLITPKLKIEEIIIINQLISIYSAKDATSLEKTDRSLATNDAVDKIFTINDVTAQNVDLAQRNSIDISDGLIDELDKANGWSRVQNDDGYDWNKCSIGQLPW